MSSTPLQCEKSSRSASIIGILVMRRIKRRTWMMPIQISTSAKCYEHKKQHSSQLHSPTIIFQSHWDKTTFNVKYTLIFQLDRKPSCNPPSPKRRKTKRSFINKQVWMEMRHKIKFPETGKIKRHSGQNQTKQKLKLLKESTISTLPI